MSLIRITNRRGQSFELSQEVHKLGRAVDNDIVLADPSISRYHLALQPISDGVIIYNTGSEAGFYLNNEWHMDNAKAQGGDILRVGSEEFTIEAPKIEDINFNFNTTPDNSNSAALNVNPNNKLRTILFVVIGIMIIAIFFQKSEENKKESAAEKKEKPTKELPSESYSNIESPKLGPQEIAAYDLYKQGNRELSNKNYIRAIYWYQQSLLEDPSLTKAEYALKDTEAQLKNEIINIVEKSEKNLLENRLQLSRAESLQALDLISEQISDYSNEIQQKQRSLANQKLPTLSRDQLYLDIPCERAPDTNICKRAVEVLKRARILLGEENVLK
jgi:pSer/pThr/pTyr-binding forkhead associated (FHA) protein